MTRPHRRLPLRARLVAGFAAAMLLVLACAGGFVFWRVRYALDLRLDSDLAQQAADLQRSVAAHPNDPQAAIDAVTSRGRLDLLLRPDGRVLASGQDLPIASLGAVSYLDEAAQGPVRYSRGNVWSPPGRHLRISAFPLGGEPAAVGVTAVRLDQRDEALRELLLQLAVANLLALAVASAVGYRLAHAALAPVERYRARAEQITAGATGVRLEVPDDTDDEVTRLGHTLNTMLAAQEDAAARQRRFIADASHELRTPLTLLTSEVELALRRPRSTAELEETLRAVAEDTQRLVTLADTLLTFESADAAAVRLGDVEADGALADAARTARAALPTDTPRSVTTEASHLVVRADRMALTRILGNLAENAARHGRGAITLSADAAGPAVRLTVHDEGAIPASFLAEAADRFRRADSTRAVQGTGLGLALVDALVTAHGGQLRICSDGSHHGRATAEAALAKIPCAHPVAGTSVSVLLPARQADG